MTNTPTSSRSTNSPEFGDYAAEYEEWGHPQRAAVEQLVAQSLPFDHSAPIRVLDAGAGTGFIRDALDHAGALRSAALYCLDTSHSMLCFGAQKPGFTPIIADATALPFADLEFHRVYSSFTIHWLADQAPFFREARRVLRPGGRLHVAVPVAGSLSEFRAAIEPHAAAAGYQLNLELYPEANVISAKAAESGFAIANSSIAEFSYTPDSIRDMLAFMRYAGAGRFVRPRHTGDFMRFAMRLNRHAAPAIINFRVLLLHAENNI